MKFEIEDQDNYRIIRCSGVLGGNIRDFSDETLHPLIEGQASRILFDLSGVDRISTEAIGVLVTLVSRSNAKGSRVVFANPSKFVRAIFEATQINKFLETEDTVEAGLEKLLSDS